MDSSRSFTELRRSTQPGSADLASTRRIEVRKDVRFRYGYICRLIDDSQIQDLPPVLRARIRSEHKSFYWKSLSLLKRDANRVLKLQREKMASQQQWDFQALTNDYIRIQTLLAKLTLAGMSHSIRLGAGLESAQRACRECEAFLTASAFPASAITSSAAHAA
jgi:hypothetical protein